MDVNMRIVLLGMVSACLVCLVAAGAREEIPDFEFEDSFETAHRPPQKPRESSFAFDDFDDFFIDDGSEPEFDIATKEKTIHRALFKALAAKDLKYKFSEVLPLLRALSKSQRMVFASIISAQLNGGKSLTLDEVKTMFGELNNKPLLLPIVYDLANLVREGFLRSDKYHEHEKQNKNQFLRRSFDSRAHATKEIEFSAPSNMMRDESLQIDMGEPTTRDVHENFDNLKPEALMMILNSSRDVSTEKSSLLLPRSQTSSRKNLTMEQVESLALSGLNGTFRETLKDVNGSDISPEALIGNGGRYRKRPPQSPYRSKGPFPEPCERFTGGLCLNVKNYPMNDIMGSIRRHRHAMEALLAEYRDKTAELEQLDYLGDPTADLSDLRRRQDSNGASSPGSMCSSIIRYARPQKARSATGEWKFIVNTGEHTQTLRLEKCSQPLEPCSYLTENFESSCTQVYNYHRLLSWDNNRGLHVDIFKVPTCCSCHLVGYKEAFPPLAQPSNSISSVSANRHRPPTPNVDSFPASSNRNSQYDTLNGSDDLEEDNDSNIAYQFGNGFKRLKPKQVAAASVPENVEIPKNRFSTKRVPTFPDTFLTPPANNQESNFPFTHREQHRQRTPAIKRKHFDQHAAETDLKISRVTVFPPKSYSQSERTRKVTPSISATVDTSSVNLRLPNAQNPDPKRINYNYHPIIDFFEDEEPKRNGIDRKTGKMGLDARSDENSWRPMVSG